MQVKPTVFEFTGYTADWAKKELLFSYAINFEGQEPLQFTERLVLPASPTGGPENQKISADIPLQLLENILQGLHLILGISYYKLYIPPKLKLPYKITRAQAQFWNTVYKNGLGEFLYRNSLSPDQLAKFPAEKANPPAGGATAIEFPRQDRVLSAIGGGKDSVVSTELLKAGKFEVTTLYTQTQKPNEQVQKLLEAFKLPNLTIERYLDEKIFSSGRGSASGGNKYPGSYNGHIPVSAIFAFIGTLVGILYDHRYVVVANEWSSNFGNVEYRGLKVNHQWSKSQEFEELFQDYARQFITPDVVYFSLLRHSSELRIAKLFSKYIKYFELFSSCNRVAVIASKAKQSSLDRHGVPRDDKKEKWCSACPKCAFAFTILSPFIPKKQLIGIFGKDLFADKTLAPIFADISGKGTMKPFDCVGTFEEVTAALYLARSHSEPAKNLIRSFGLRPQDDATIAASLQTHPAPLIPAQFAFLGMEKALILGYGREGKVTKAYLKKQYPKLKIGVADQADDKKYLDKQADYDIAVKTPGIPKELVKIFYTTATNIFLSSLSFRSIHPKSMVIGVTGSKGKSTTASLIYAILKEANIPAKLLGNIGEPMLSYIPNSHELAHKQDVLVLELSSYMLDDIQASPHIAVITSLFPDHMNYHGSLENYYDAKKNILRYQRAGDYFVFNPKVGILNEWIKEARAVAVPYQAELPLPESEVPLLGAHNRDNIRAAVTVTKLLNISDDVSAAAIRKFKGLAHRLELVGEFKGIKFYDDANATTPDATIQALKSLPDTETIFLGGEDRGYDFSYLEEMIHRSRIKNVVLFPETGKRIFHNPRKLKILSTKSLQKAVEFAYKNTAPGKICLLSMASPSYSLWKDFIAKGNEFQKFVKLTGKKK